MPRITIHRQPEVVSDEAVTKIRDAAHASVVKHLKVKEKEVEVKILDFGKLDLNCPPIGIDIDTGTGKENIRVRNKKELCEAIAADMDRSESLLPEWLGPEKSYIWIMICESAFVPIGSPDKAR